MKFSLLPKEYEFFDMFDKLALHACEATRFFKEHVKEGNFDDAEVQRMRDIEHKADDITHDIINKLNTTFITPFDREDIYSIAHELDSIVDLVLTMSNKMRIFRLREVNNNLIRFSDLIGEAVCALEKAIKGLREHKKPDRIMEFCIEINRIENVGDQLRNTVIADLFDNHSDPIYIMKWKEVFEDAETILDQCEDVANVIESILVKQA